jgi:hypothetical protein
VQILSWFWKNTFLIGVLVLEGSMILTRKRIKYAFVTWAAFTVLLFALSGLVSRRWQWSGDLVSLQNIIWNSSWQILMAVCTVLQIYYFTEISILNAVFLMEIAVVSQNMQFGLYKLLEAFFLGEAAQRTPGIPSVLINLCLLAATAAALYTLFGKKRQQQMTLDSRDRVVILIIAVLFIIHKFLSAYLYVFDANSNFGMTMVVIQLHFLLFNLVVLYMLNNMIARRSLEREQLIMEAVARQKETQYQFSHELIDSMNIKSHDLKKQIRYLQNHSENQDSFLSELETLTDHFDSNIYTDNSALTAVLSEKSLICSANSIPFTCMAGGSEIGFMRDIDIYTLFANLLDNAIEASLKLPPEGRCITLVVRQQFAFLSIHVSNYFSGELLEENGELITSKSDRSAHGFGSRSIRQIVEKYDGNLSYKNEDKVFTVNILIPVPEE